MVKLFFFLIKRWLNILGLIKNNLSNNFAKMEFLGWLNADYNLTAAILKTYCSRFFFFPQGTKYIQNVSS